MNNKKITWEEAVENLRRDPASRALVENCFFDDPLLGACQRYHRSIEWRAVQRIIGTGTGAALDVGAGRGIASYALAKDGWQTTALEPDPSGLIGTGAIREINRIGGVEIDIKETWGEGLPFPDASFDLVFCRQVLHHARDLAKFCAEIGRVLKPGGKMLAIREHVISRREDLPQFLANHPLHRYYGGENAYLLEEYLTHLRGGGLRVDTIFNPYASEMNTFPYSLLEVKQGIARRLKFPFPALIPDCLLAWRGNHLQTPGRIYSFVAHKGS